MADDRYRNDWRGDRSGGRGRASSIFSDDDNGRRSERGAFGGSDWNPEEKGWGRSSGSNEGAGGRGFFDRARDEVRSWFGDDDGDRGGSYGRGQAERSRFGQGQSGFGGETYRSNRSSGGFSGREEGGDSGGFGGYGGSAASRQSHFDENYRRWRDQQIARLDQEYEDYCRERQHRFESDFDTWRQSRHGETGQGQGPQSFGETGDGFDSGSGMSGESESGGAASTRSALLGDESASETTTGGGDASALESSTGSSPDTTGGTGRGRG